MKEQKTIRVNITPEEVLADLVDIVVRNVKTNASEEELLNSATINVMRNSKIAISVNQQVWSTKRGSLEYLTSTKLNKELRMYVGWVVYRVTGDNKIILVQTDI